MIARMGHVDVAGVRFELPDGRVLRGEPELWRRHLEREFHQQLLDQVG